MPQPIRPDRAVMEYDVVVVGGGPAGLSCAIRLKQLRPETTVCVLEKGAAIGAHLLSGAVFEPRALNEFLPDWAQNGAPITAAATSDAFVWLTEKRTFSLPVPPQLNNHGNYIVSLSELGAWLGQQAEGLGVEIYPGFAGHEVLYNDAGAVIGVATPDMGIGKDGGPTAQFQAGMELHGTQTILAEGCHGSLSKQVIEKFDLRRGKSPQTYGLGVKEIWEVPAEKFRGGHVVHTVGWPLGNDTYGGGWIYHWRDNLVSVGYVTGLDYQNPYLSPFEEMQRFKTHPYVRDLLTGGKRIAYGARTLVEGGLQSLPKLTFAGGMLIGDAAGFLNAGKIKGNHAAMKSGTLAAEALAAGWPSAHGAECTAYPAAFDKSWLYDELYRVRNLHAGFKFGRLIGMAHAAFQAYGGWRLPYTLSNHADYACLKPAKDVPPIVYPKPDGALTFDRLSSVYLTNTFHEENQPSHLKLRDPAVPIAHNLPLYDEPAQRYCPAGVYEIIEESGEKRFQINAANCIHCKTCDIKDPSQNIIWTTPQGGGPNYSNL